MENCLVQYVVLIIALMSTFVLQILPVKMEKERLIVYAKKVTWIFDLVYLKIKLIILK
ncbi:hypothetical protein WUBG_19197 [Wuchereria bancrofti]|uniref:Uncharacterized protein n=1 Tax=Wuchereria bancrofti TaxID=6293 RepID=J9DKA6_WUCBA|nr:hypothetical protein WUBG_19197 [Wuchereria bancrofti]